MFLLKHIFCIPLNAHSDVLLLRIVRYFTSLATNIPVISFLGQYSNIVRVFCNVLYFNRLPTGYAGQSVFELLVVKSTKLV
jgi:hypothetical protein